MKELIPFKKDIIFKTRISSIKNISLEHDYKVIDDVIDGEFILTGEYKMTEASTITEEFLYKIPFMISIDESINKNSIDLTINDFNYFIKNEDVLEINTKLLLFCEKEEKIEEFLEEIEEIEEIRENDVEEEKIIENERDFNINKEINIETDDMIINQGNINNVTNIVNEKDKYVTYKIYIIKKEDTMESILTNFNIDEAIFKKYNKTEIAVGDKIIIPFKDE